MSCCLLSDSSWEKKIHDLEKGGRIDNWFVKEIIVLFLSFPVYLKFY